MPEETKDDKAEQEQAAKVLEEGRFAATEGDDNAVYTSDDNYVGVDEVYKDHAYDEQAPLAADEDSPEKAIFDRVVKETKERDDRMVHTNRRGVTTQPVHPSERTKPGVVADPSRETVDVTASAAPPLRSAQATEDQKPEVQKAPAQKAPATPQPAKD